MSQTTLITIAIVLSSLALILSLASLWLSKKRSDFSKVFGAENQPDNLEDVIGSITELLKKLKADQVTSQEQIQTIQNTLQTSFLYSSVIRFNSNGSDGGNLSFSMALLDGQQSGIILTSLHGRDHNRIYCKGVIKGESQQQLSEEERQAFIEALTTKRQLPKPEKKLKTN